MKRRIGGRWLTLVVGLALLLYGLGTAYITLRFMQRAVPATGTIMWRSRRALTVQCRNSDGSSRILDVARPMFSLPWSFLPQEQIPILYDPQAAYSITDPGYNFFFPARGRINSPFHIWAGHLFFIVLGLLFLIAYFLSAREPHRFQVVVNVETGR